MPLHHYSSLTCVKYFSSFSVRFLERLVCTHSFPIPLLIQYSLLFYPHSKTKILHSKILYDLIVKFSGCFSVLSTIHSQIVKHFVLDFQKFISEQSRFMRYLPCLAFSLSLSLSLFLSLSLSLPPFLQDLTLLHREGLNFWA